MKKFDRGVAGRLRKTALVIAVGLSLAGPAAVLAQSNVTGSIFGSIAIPVETVHV